MSNDRKAFLVCGLAYGDEGKGATVDYLVRKHNAGLVVRYNGGPQAGHNVVTEDKWHTFSQFGSGSLVPGVKTHLSRFMLVDPISMTNEAGGLARIGVHGIYERTTVEEDCVIITPFQKAMNRIVEWSRGENCHGTCGFGVGQARSDALEYGDKVLYAKDVRSEETALAKLKFLKGVCQERVEALGITACPTNIQQELNLLRYIDSESAWWWLLRVYKRWSAQIVPENHLQHLLESTQNVVFEGAQGVLLDEVHGTVPHNTWTNTRFDNASVLLRQAGFDGVVKRIGVLRSYFTRHGAGPFSSEVEWLKKRFPEPHNSDDGYQGRFRCGWLDVEAARYAIRVCNRVDEIAMNHLDYAAGLDNMRVRISCQDGLVTIGQRFYLKRIEDLLEVPITTVAYGPKAEDRSEHVTAGISLRKSQAG